MVQLKANLFYFISQSEILLRLNVLSSQQYRMKTKLVFNGTKDMTLNQPKQQWRGMYKRRWIKNQANPVIVHAFTSVHKNNIKKPYNYNG